jgi:site-specific DNA-cytosine methylase
LSYTYTNFIPLIGPFHWAAKDLGLTCIQTVSFPKMQGNEQHIKANDPSVPDAILLPDEMLDNFTYDLLEMKEKIQELNIKKTDFVFGLPPCSGFSQLSVKTGAEEKANICMLEIIKFYLATDSEVLLFENAPGLAGEKGQIFLRDYVYKILIQNNVQDRYRFNLIKTDTDQHGLPQHRPRTFFIMYKGNKFKKINNTRIVTFISVEELFKDLPIEEDAGRQHISVHSNFGDEFLSYINDSDKGHKIIEEILEEKKFKKDWRYDIISTVAKKMCNKEDILDSNYPLLNKNLILLKEKIDRKGMFTFRDSGPILFQDFTSAIVGKNAINTVRNFNGKFRYITMREKARLMGYPDSFNLVDPIKNANHICQNAPLFTVKDSIRWAIQIYENNNLDIIDSNGIYLYQINTHSNMNKEVFLYQDSKLIPMHKLEKEEDIFNGFI